MWELDYKESWTLKNWCFQTVALEKTPESPLDSKEIKPVNPKRSQPWLFIGITHAKVKVPILWLPDAKSWLTGKDSGAGKDKQEEKGATEGKMVGWHYWLNGHEFEEMVKLQEMVKDREAWCAAVHGSQRVRHGLATEQLIQKDFTPRSLNISAKTHFPNKGHIHCYLGLGLR